MSNDLKKIILKIYLKHTEEGSTIGLYFHEVAKELELEENQVVSECEYLLDDGLIEEIISGGLDDRKHTIGVRITSKGKEALHTIYNPEWIKQQEKKKKEAKDLDDKRHRELVNSTKGSTIVKIGVIAAITISLLSFFGVDDIMFNPRIEINPFFTDPTNSTTQMYVNIWNYGNSPATNVRITLNPNADFLKNELVYSAEDTTLIKSGPRALVAFTPRFSSGEHITINTIIGIPLDRSNFDIYLTYDQGEKISYSSKRDGKTPFNEIIITVPEKPESVELKIYDPVTDEFVPVEP